jgi:hypothetical protein
VRRTSTHVTVCLLLAVSTASAHHEVAQLTGHATMPNGTVTGAVVTTEEYDVRIVCKGFT